MWKGCDRIQSCCHSWGTFHRSSSESATPERQQACPGPHVSVPQMDMQMMSLPGQTSCLECLSKIHITLFHMVFESLCHQLFALALYVFPFNQVYHYPPERSSFSLWWWTFAAPPMESKEVHKSTRSSDMSTTFRALKGLQRGCLRTEEKMYSKKRTQASKTVQRGSKNVFVVFNSNLFCCL